MEINNRPYGFGTNINFILNRPYNFEQTLFMESPLRNNAAIEVMAFLSFLSRM